MPSCNTTPLIESRVKYWALIHTEANMDEWMDGWMRTSVRGITLSEEYSLYDVQM